MGEFVRVAGTDDVKPWHGMVAEVNGKALAVFNVEVISRHRQYLRPPRRTARRGRARSGRRDLPMARVAVQCPTGACVNNPSAKSKRYQVKVEGTTSKALL
jgi:hypothetical protein